MRFELTDCSLVGQHVAMRGVAEDLERDSGVGANRESLRRSDVHW